MNCRIEKSELSGTIVCPASKSYTHRGVFLASLAKGRSLVDNFLESDDTKATIEACKKFGAKITQNDSSLEISGIGTNEVNAANIDAKNSGTTIRIASAIAALASGTSKLTGDSSLQKRPMQVLLDALEKLGAKCKSTNGCPPLEIIGKMNGGEVSVPGNISSQFLSALLIAGPKMKEGITLNVDSELVSKPYLNSTIVTMKEFGVDVKVEIPDKKYIVTPQMYQAGNFLVPSDFSSLSLLLASAILVGKNLSIKVTSDDLPQADKEFLEIVKKLGIRVDIEENLITVDSPQEIGGGEFDLSNNPDLLPPLAILALKTKQNIKIVNVKHARFKETDRIAILASELAKIGIKVIEDEDGLDLRRGEKMQGAQLNSHHDHRLFMAFCIAGTYVGNCIVTDYESASVSYPNFISEMKKCGLKVILDV